MKVRTEHRGRHLPFERNRRIVLRRLPQGARVTRAVVTVTPFSTDPGRRFLETIAFPDAVGGWGANKTLTTHVVEIDLHARRKLASMVGTNLAPGSLLVDLGGGFMPVNADGGLGGDATFHPADNAPDLPGLTVTGLRIANPSANPNPDISLLRVTSPPSNVTLAIEGGPVFFSHFGDLVEPVTTPDFADVLTALLPRLDVVDGYHVIPFALHSDTIARLDLALEVDITVAVSATPPGVTSVQAPYRYNGMAEQGKGRLAVTVPPGMIAVPGGTAGRVQGAFESTRVVFGTLTTKPPAELVHVSGSQPLAQPFVLPQTEVASSVDLLLTAVTPEVRLSVDIVDDLDGKPGRTSQLTAIANLTLTRDQATSPTWVNVALPGEVEFGTGLRRWLVLQALDGTAAWGCAAAPSPDDVGLQRTDDGGLSWRVATGTTVTGPLAAQLRLRHVTPTFHMPLELRVASGGDEVAVSLQRFAPQGTVDLNLDFPEVAVAVNDALAAGRTGAATAEHVANGDFSRWYRIGTALSSRGTLEPTPASDITIGPPAFSADGSVLLAGAVGEEMRFTAFDPLCGDQLLLTEIGAGLPTAMVTEPSGRRALVAAVNPTDFESSPARRGRFVLVDTATGRPLGVPVVSPEPVIALAVSGDGGSVYTLGPDGESSCVLRRIPWATLLAASDGAATELADQPSAQLAGVPAGLAAAPDGRVFVVTRSGATSRLHMYADAAAVDARFSHDVETLPDSTDLAVTPAGDEVLVLAPQALRIVRANDLTTVTTIPLDSTTARRVGVDPTGEVAVIVQEGPLLTYDVRRRTVQRSTVAVSGTPDGAWLATSPTGTHAVVTRLGSRDAVLVGIGIPQPVDWELTAGQVRPWCLGGTGDTLAVLGTSGGAARGGTPVPSAISQVVAAVGGTRYRFAFAGISDVEGSLGEVIWRGDDCAVARNDRVPVTVFDTDQRVALDHLPTHELVVVSPPGATQAEVRFSAPEGQLGVDAVSLAASTNTVTQTWQPSAPTLTVSRSPVPGAATGRATTPARAGGLAVSNGGSRPATLSQIVAAPAGQSYDLSVSARLDEASADGVAVELEFRDDVAATVGEVVRLDLDRLAFDDRAAAGQVPPGAAEAEIRLVVPPGGAVELRALNLVIAPTTEVQLHLVSEAPGQLTASGVVVQLDHAQPTAPPPPPTGLCPPTTEGGGDGDSCFCPSCGRERPVRQQVAVTTAAGRPGAVASCPICGTDRVRVGGRLTRSAIPVWVPQFQVAARPPVPSTGHVRARPAVTVTVQLDAPLTAINGIGPARAAELPRLGIASVVALAEADVGTVERLRGVSRRQAATLIARAAQLVRDQGVRVLFPVR